MNDQSCGIRRCLTIPFALIGNYRPSSKEQYQPQIMPTALDSGTGRRLGTPWLGRLLLHHSGSAPSLSCYRQLCSNRATLYIKFTLCVMKKVGFFENKPGGKVKHLLSGWCFI